jgi:hypothetical protein
MLTVYRRSAHGAESQAITDLRSPTVEDWQKWKPNIMTRYKAIPARLFIREMEAEGLRVTCVHIEVENVALLVLTYFVV